MRIYRIGTRGSPLALTQTQELIRALVARYPSLEHRLEILPIKTTGDSIMDRSLMDAGGKSLFTKEIEAALLTKAVDIAVHSMKDMTTDLPEGLSVPIMLEREDPRDALITREGQLLEDLPEGALFGTSSLRRQAYVLHKFPHFQTISLRGNVLTRLQKIDKGEMDATLLAVAGLKRLNLLDKATAILPLEDFLPAVGQGAIGIQCREDDNDVLEMVGPLNHFPTFQAVRAERAFMKALHGSCRTPMAAYGILEGESLFLKGMISDANGHNMRFISHKGLAVEAETIGREAAQLLQENTCPASS